MWLRVLYILAVLYAVSQWIIIPLIGATPVFRDSSSAITAVICSLIILVTITLSLALRRN